MLLCTDISVAMIEHTKQELARASVGDNVTYRVLNGVDFSGVEDASVDFIFSYDVQLHLQPQNVFSYMLDARRVLREDGVFMLHQINLASEGGMMHFLTQYAGSTWKRAFDDPRRRGHVYFMSADQMAVLATQARLEVECILDDWEQFHQVGGGRDLIGFLRARRSRLDEAAPDEVELLKAVDGLTVYAVIDGRRLGLTSARQFERAGFRWENVREVAAAALEDTPDGGILELWE